MSLLPFLVITQVAAVLALLGRRLPAAAIGIGGLALATVAAATIAPGDRTTIGGEPLVTSAYLRIFLVVASGSGFLVAVLGYAAGWHRHVPAAILASLGWAGLALALTDPGTAFLAATVAGVAVVLGTLSPSRVAGRDRGVGPSGRELRAVSASASSPDSCASTRPPAAWLRRARCRSAPAAVLRAVRPDPVPDPDRRR